MLLLRAGVPLWEPARDDRREPMEERRESEGGVSANCRMDFSNSARVRERAQERCICAAEMLTFNLAVNVFALEIRDELEEIVFCAATVCRGNDLVWVEAELFSLGCPGGLDGGDRVGQGAVHVK